MRASLWTHHAVRDDTTGRLVRLPGAEPRRPLPAIPPQAKRGPVEPMTDDRRVAVYRQTNGHPAGILSPLTPAQARRYRLKRNAGLARQRREEAGNR